LYCEGDASLLFTENETNHERLFGTRNASPYLKDGINNFVVNGSTYAVNPAQTGTKAAADYPLTVAGGQTQVIRLRLTTAAPAIMRNPFGDFEKIVSERLRDADEFYESITPPAIKTDVDRKRVMRQALAGMLWTKQYFYYDVSTWLKEHRVGPNSPPEVRQRVRNAEWFHMINDDIISMPDKWEYPWYAAWDLAFHTLALAVVDPDFAKSQLDLMLRNDYLHPNGQLPAYEWNFADVNPPVHAFATMQIYLQDKERNQGKGDIQFLAYAFSKLLMNFTWWVNRKDRSGNNVFEGGFLGLDNIGVFDRSSPLPTGGSLEQADGTAWMAFFSQQMLRIAVELGAGDRVDVDRARQARRHQLQHGLVDRGLRDHAARRGDREQLLALADLRPFLDRLAHPHAPFGPGVDDHARDRRRDLRLHQLVLVLLQLVLLELQARFAGRDGGLVVRDPRVGLQLGALESAAGFGQVGRELLLLARVLVLLEELQREIGLLELHVGALEFQVVAVELGLRQESLVVEGLRPGERRLRLRALLLREEDLVLVVLAQLLEVALEVLVLIELGELQLAVRGFDVARVLAIAFMVQGHTLDVLLAPAYRQGFVFNSWLFLRGLTAPMFFMLSGMAFATSSLSRWESYAEFSPALFRRFGRYAFFIALGYVMHLPVKTFRGIRYLDAAGWQSWLQIDVLQCVGLTLIFLQLLVLAARVRLPAARR
jgi:hypothetical protein